MLTHLGRMFNNKPKVAENMDEVSALKKSCDKKINFFVDICHDLKTPLNVIMGAAKLIELSEDKYGQDAKIRKNVRIIERNCYYLLRLLNNIIDLAGLDISKIRLSPVPCNLTVLVANIVAAMAPFGEEKGVTLEFLNEDREINAEIDIHIIERIMLNLLSNAISYTPGGGKVTVQVSEGTNDTVIISVKDTGHGIPEEMKAKIFNRYTSVRGGLFEYGNGNGIGLSLVKSLVELHRGNIALASEINRGSEFTVTLPAQSAEKNPNPGFLSLGISGHLSEQ